MYKEVENKSWAEILADNKFQWQPPKTVHLAIQPMHASDLIHVDAALNVYRRRTLFLDWSQAQTSSARMCRV